MTDKGPALGWEAEKRGDGSGELREAGRAWKAGHRDWDESHMRYTLLHSMFYRNVLNFSSGTKKSIRDFPGPKHIALSWK